MLKILRNQRVDCYLQAGSTISEKECLVGTFTKTPKGLRFEQETKTTKTRTRNPKIYDNQHISVVRRADNSLKFSFKELKPGASLETFASEVYWEIAAAILSIK